MARKFVYNETWAALRRCWDMTDLLHNRELVVRKPSVMTSFYAAMKCCDVGWYIHATNSCNVIDRHNFLAQKLEAKIVRMVSVHYHVHRLVSACYYAAADLYSLVYELRKHFHAIMEVFYCFPVAIDLPGDALDYNEDKKAGSCSAHAKQGGCRVRQQCEHGVRFWLFGPHWSRCQKIKMMAICVVLGRLMKTKMLNMVLSFCQHCYLTWQNSATFFRLDVCINIQ